MAMNRYRTRKVKRFVNSKMILDFISKNIKFLESLDNTIFQIEKRDIGLGDKSKRFSTKLVKKYRKRIDILTKSLSSKKRGSNRFKKVKKHLHKTHKRLNNTKMDYLNNC